MIKGYDAQVMLHRTVDLQRDASAMSRRNDTAQSLMVDQQREKTEREQETVSHLLETQEGKVRADADGRRRSKPDRQRRGNNETEETIDGETGEPKVFPVHSRVDIRI